MYHLLFQIWSLQVMSQLLSELTGLQKYPGSIISLSHRFLSFLQGIKWIILMQKSTNSLPSVLYSSFWHIDDFYISWEYTLSWCSSAWCLSIGWGPHFQTVCVSHFVGILITQMSLAFSCLKSVNSRLMSNLAPVWTQKHRESHGHHCSDLLVERFRV